MKRGRPAKAGRRKVAVKLPKRKLPDWMVRRWAKRVVKFLSRVRNDGVVPLETLVKVAGLTRQGWEKFEKFGKVGPLFTSVLRACRAFLQRKWIIVITLEGPWILRLRGAGAHARCCNPSCVFNRRVRG